MRDEGLTIWKTRAPHSRNWVVRWIDPDTGRRRQWSTRTKKPKEAERQLGELRAKLLKGLHRAASFVTWETFRNRYESEVLPGLARKTQLKVGTVFDTVERLIHPHRLRDINADKISLFQSQLRAKGRAETTIAGSLCANMTETLAPLFITVEGQEGTSHGKNDE